MGRSKAFNLANMLTYGRLAAVPAVVGLLFWPEDHWSRWFALAVFAIAAITDYLDGYVARTYRAAIGPRAHARPHRRQASGGRDAC